MRSTEKDSLFDGTEDLAVIKELQREVERQADLIYQLRQDNVGLRLKLDSERNMCQIYADRLQKLQSDWEMQMHLLDRDVNSDFLHSSSTFSENNGFGTEFMGSGLTIRTRIPTPPLEESEREEGLSPDCSEYDASVGAEMEVVHRYDRARKLKTGRFFAKARAKQHKRTTSLRQLQARIHCSEQVVCSKGDDTSSPMKKLDPIKRDAVDDSVDSLSRIGWTSSDLGQRLALVKDSYLKQKEVFDDDIRFMKEVLNGLSHAPEMDIEVELRDMVKDFKLWKRQFEDSVKALRIDLRCADASMASARKEGKRTLTRRPTMAASIGKIFHRSGPTDQADLMCQGRTMSATQ